MAKRLFRSAHQKMLGGVCAGLAEYLDIDVSIVRLLWVGLALVTAVLPMTFFYIVAWITPSLQISGFGAAFIGALLIAIISTLLSHLLVN